MKIFLSAVSALLLVLCCCKKQEIFVFNQSDFPVSKGNYWVYKFKDFRYGFTDTFKIEVRKIEEIVGDTQKVSFYIYNGDVITDSAQGIITAKEFIYTGPPMFSLFGDFRVVFPFFVNSSWQNNSSTDTISVISYCQTDLTTTLNFKDAFFLYSFYQKGQTLRINEIYISKGVGVIKKTIQDEDALMINSRKQDFTLIDYAIN